MKHLLLIFVGIAIAVPVAFVLLREDAISPNGSLLSPSIMPSGNITVTSPRPGDTVGSSITVTGMARTFEQNVQWRLRTMTGAPLTSGFTTATAQDIGQFGAYTFTITVPPSAPKQLVIEVFETDAKTGSEVSKVSIPVTRE